MKVDLPVQRDGHQSEDTNIDAKNLHSGTKLTHEGRQIPALQESRVELKGNGKDGYGDIGKGQISNVHVGDCPHASGDHHHVNDQGITNKGCETNKAIKERQYDHHEGRHVVQIELAFRIKAAVIVGAVAIADGVIGKYGIICGVVVQERF